MTISARITRRTISQTIARDPTRGRGRRPLGAGAAPAGLPHASAPDAGVRHVALGVRASGVAPADPDLVFAALVGAAVEPAVELLGHEARVLDEGVPLGRRQPVEGEARALLGAPDGERERAGALVPVGALEDARLALEPEPVGLLDVRRARREDVEHEPAARLEE